MKRADRIDGVKDCVRTPDLEQVVFEAGLRKLLLRPAPRHEVNAYIATADYTNRQLERSARRVARPSDVEDLISEALTILLRQLRDSKKVAFGWDGRVGGFWRKVLSRRVWNAHRLQNRLNLHGRLSFDNDSCERAEARHDLDTINARLDVEMALDKLSKGPRQMVEWVAIKGFPYLEVERVTGVERHRVSAIVRRSFAELRQLLSSYS